MHGSWRRCTAASPAALHHTGEAPAPCSQADTPAAAEPWLRVAWRVGGGGVAARGHVAVRGAELNCGAEAPRGGGATRRGLGLIFTQPNASGGDPRAGLGAQRDPDPRRRTGKRSGIWGHLSSKNAGPYSRVVATAQACARTAPQPAVLVPCRCRPGAPKTHNLYSTAHDPWAPPFKPALKAANSARAPPSPGRRAPRRTVGPTCRAPRPARPDGGSPGAVAAPAAVAAAVVAAAGPDPQSPPRAHSRPWRTQAAL